jgi:hypothetical protein
MVLLRGHEPVHVGALAPVMRLACRLNMLTLLSFQHTTNRPGHPAEWRGVSLTYHQA